MTLPDVYLDEDAQSDALIEALRARNVMVLTTTEAGMARHTDEEQLRFAEARKLVLATCNVADYTRLHSQWLMAGLEHAGIILIQQQKWGGGGRVGVAYNSPSGGFPRAEHA